MKARQVMTESPQVVTPEEPLARAAQLMESFDVGIIPVVEDRVGMRLAGIITDRDMAIRHVARAHDGRCAVRDHMTSGPLDVVRPGDDVHDVMGRMGHDKLRRMPVVDRDHRLIGVISQADIARKVGPAEPARVERVLEAISQPVRVSLHA
ncbi:MAG TPA: CBS domain-containing protein [Longimicrobiales bacterium]|nr:CBS domain-containing protein [Longimicrobiales bacterium]